MWNSKPKKSDCNCRGRHHGNPKIGGGICHWGVRPSAQERTANRRLAKRWLDAVRAREELDE